MISQNILYQIKAHENCIYRRVICVFLTKNNFLKKSWRSTPDKEFEKMFLNWNISVYISVDVVFDGDHEFDILLVEKCNKKKAKIARYELYYIFQPKEYQIRDLRQKLRSLIYKLRCFSSKTFFQILCLGYPSRTFSKNCFSSKIHKWHVYRCSFLWILRICYYFLWKCLHEEWKP